MEKLTAEQVRIEIRNIEDRAYSMRYYNQRLRPANDCRRISIAEHEDIIRLLESYASQVRSEEMEKQRERIEKLKFMIDNGLGWDDMKNDITYPV